MNRLTQQASIAVSLILACLILIDANITLYIYDKLFVTDAKLQSTFNGKRVWITGASSGIGAVLADQLAAKGAKLTLSARRKDRLEDLAQKFEKSYNNTSTNIVTFDMKNEPSSLESIVDKVLEITGGIDILVLNAGFFQEQLALDASPKLVNEIMTVNYFSPVHIAMELIRRDEWKSKKKGHIVINSSLFGTHVAPYSSLYSATKHSLNGFFHVLKTESTDWNLKINIVCPGPVQTDIHESSVKNKEISLWNTFPIQLSVERCVRLIMSTMTGSGIFFLEVWMGPIATMLSYAHRYCPILGRALYGILGKVLSMYHNDVLRLW